MNGKENVMQPYNEIVFSHEKEWSTDTRCTVDEPKTPRCPSFRRRALSRSSPAGTLNVFEDFFLSKLLKVDSLGLSDWVITFYYSFLLSFGWTMANFLNLPFSFNGIWNAVTSSIHPSAHLSQEIDAPPLPPPRPKGEYCYVMLTPHRPLW